VRLAAEFVSDPEEKRAYISQTRTAQTERETPLWYEADDFDDEKRRLLDVLRLRLARGETIAILLPLKRQVFGFAKGLRDAGLEVETPDDLDFSTSLPKLITYHSAKGLTFDSVLLPRLVPGSFPRMSLGRIEHLLFVAISRATKWVYMSTTGSGVAPLDRLRARPDSDWLTLQRAGAAPRVQPLPPGDPSAEDDLLDLL
jgi:superfamily I DNA/RNA helicase